jgi:hypothetical protein
MACGPAASKDLPAEPGAAGEPEGEPGARLSGDERRPLLTPPVSRCGPKARSIRGAMRIHRAGSSTRER